MNNISKNYNESASKTFLHFVRSSLSFWAHNLEKVNINKYVLDCRAVQLEEAKKELLANITKIEKTEAANIASIFHGFGRYIKNIVVFFTRNILTKKALPQPK